MALLGALLSLALTLRLVSAGVLETAGIHSIVTVKLSNSDTKVDIDCTLYPGTKPWIDRIDPTYHMKWVDFNRCPVPSSSYAAILTEIGINVDRLIELSLYDVPSAPALSKHHFDGLPNLMNLKIYGERGEMIRPESDYLTPLKNLSKIEVTNMEFHPMPARTQVAWVKLINGSSQGEWGGCDELQRLYIVKWGIPDSDTGAGWLSHCPKLYSLSLTSMSRQMIDRALAGLRLTELTISNCDIPELNKELIASFDKLADLKITESGLTNIASDAFSLSQHQSISRLDFSHNSLTGSALDALVPLRKITLLTLSYNPKLHDFCDHFIGRDHPELMGLDLIHSGITRFCFRDMHQLTSISLGSNDIQTINIDELALHDREYSVLLHLEDNPINSVIFSQDTYETLMIFNKTTNSTTPRIEDPIANFITDRNTTMSCAGADFQRLKGAAAQDKLIYITQYKCLVGCGACQCARGEYEVHAWCAHALLTHIPHIDKLTELHAAGNDIHTFNADDIPASLMLVDLRNNSISVLPAKSARTLFSEYHRKVQLAGNPISCECDNIHLLKQLHDHTSMVDFDQLTCAESGKPVQQLNLTGMCGAAHALTTSGLLTALALITRIYM